MQLDAAIQSAMKPSPWRVGNQVLYDLCQRRPEHTDEADVLAKVWLIGRSYAAAIERRKNKSDTDANDDFYIDKVAPAIISSPIDAWIEKARRYHRPSAESLATIVAVHHKTTQLFSRISGLQKRSLASKYLHFHVPRLFYIYDTRAVEALRLFGSVIPRAGRLRAAGDKEYGKFAEKCFSLQHYIEEERGVRLSPRQLDSVLLDIGYRGIRVVIDRPKRWGR